MQRFVKKLAYFKVLLRINDALKAEKEADDAALEEMKPKLTAMNHIKHNFDVLEREYLPEEKDLHREERAER